MYRPHQCWTELLSDAFDRRILIGQRNAVDRVLRHRGLCERVRGVAASEIEIDWFDCVRLRWKDKFWLFKIDWNQTKTYRLIWHSQTEANLMVMKWFGSRVHIIAEAFQSVIKHNHIQWTTAISISRANFLSQIQIKQHETHLCSRCSTAESSIEPCNRYSWFGTIWWLNACVRYSVDDCTGACIAFNWILNSFDLNGDRMKLRRPSFCDWF